MQAPVWNGRLDYEDTGGGGVPLVLIHAFPLHRGMWEPQAPLGAKARLITYDVRGFGRSPAGDGLIPFEQHVDDLLALLDHLKLQKAVLCGLSMGGYIALRTAERAPGRVRALILADTKTEADGNEARLKRAAGALAIQRDGLEKFAEGFVQGALAPDAAARNPRAVERVRELIRFNEPAGVRAGLLAMAGRTDTTAALPKLTMPALVLVGEHDGLTPPAAARAMASAMPNASFEALAGAGHLASLENPEAFNRAVAQFLGRLK